MVFPPKTNYAAGDVLTAAQMNNVGNALSAYQFTVGKNKLINADFRVNQRAFSSTTTTATYGMDRWRFVYSGGTTTFSIQVFTPGSAPVSGYEATNFARLVTTSQSASSDRALLNQRIEDVRTLAGQTATFSFWAKAASGAPKVNVAIQQNFGATGSTAVTVNSTAQTISTNWARYSFTISVPSISGKTISGGGDHLSFVLYVSDGGDFSTGVGAQNNTFDIWGVQAEAGSVATPFQTATGTLIGELAACQRYYIRWTKFRATAAEAASGSFSSQFSFPVSMRTAPTLATDITNANYNAAGGANTWRFVQQGVGYPTKTGTTSVNLSTIQGNSTTTATIWGSGATWSTSFNEIETNDLYVEAAAEL